MLWEFKCACGNLSLQPLILERGSTLLLQCLRISKESTSRNWYSATMLRNSLLRTGSPCTKNATLAHNHPSWRSITPAAPQSWEVYSTSPPAGHCSSGKGTTAWQTAMVSAKSSAPFPGYKNWTSKAPPWWYTTYFHISIHKQICTAWIGPSGRREEQYWPTTCVSILKLPSRTSHDELLGMCVQTQAERKHLYILTSHRIILPCPTSVKEGDSDISIPVSRYFHSKMIWPTMSWHSFPMNAIPQAFFVEFFPVLFTVSLPQHFVWTCNIFTPQWSLEIQFH